MATIFKGDDSASFGGTFITINLGTVPEGFTISKAKFKVGDLPVITFENPEFPLTVNLSPMQTRQLKQQNVCYLAVYDNEGRKLTCKGKAEFVALDEVVR